MIHYDAYTSVRTARSARTDAEWSTLVRKRDGECVLHFGGCSRQASEAHHIYARSYDKLRLMILNGITVCHNCHDILENRPAEARGMIEKAVGVGWMKRLRVMFKRSYGYDLDA